MVRVGVEAGFCSVGQADFTLAVILLPQSSECWAYKSVSLTTAL